MGWEGGDNIKVNIKLALLGFFVAPWYSIIMAVLALISGPVAALSTKYLANVIDAAITSDIRTAIVSLGLAAAMVLLAFAAALGATAARKQATRLVEAHIKAKLLTRASKIDYLTFISSVHQDAFELGDEDITDCITSMQDTLFSLITTLIEMVSFIVLLSTISGVIAITCCIAIIAVTMFTAGQSGKDQRRIRAQTADLNRNAGLLDTYYRNSAFAAEMAIFGSRQYIDKLYDDVVRKIADARTGVAIRHAKRGIGYSVFNGTVVMAALIGTMLVGGITTAGGITVVISAMLAILAGGSSIGEACADIVNSVETVKSFSDYIDHFDRDKLTPTDCIDQNASAVELRNIHYSFGELDVLKGVDITIPRGQTVAIVGENGAGKTTLANLILGLYEAQEGGVRVFGVDPYIHRDDDAFPVTAVFQQYAKYPGLTVEENVTLGRDINHNVLSSIDSFFDTLDYDAVVGTRYDDGRDFSGGEWQKIVIARCANAESELVLLDEPTAALDPMAEMRVFNNAMETYCGKTCIFITHRLGAARRADRIIALHDGIIAEDGTHDELMTKGGYYAGMFNAQAQWYTQEAKE